jgi:tRNA(Ile)-lysidine synthase
MDQARQLTGASVSHARAERDPADASSINEAAAWTDSMPSPSLPAAAVDRFRQNMADLSMPPGPFGIAVSGGPDSIALLLLAAAAFPREVRAATIDHGLRDEAAAEAAFVAGVCRSIGVQHAILAASVDRSHASLQQQARIARYATLAAWLADSGLDVLATAHHADDQAETLLMRLLRGSGVGGLAGIRACGPLPEGAPGQIVIRPLLGWRRDELAALVAGAGLTAVDDPSNRDPRFDRVRMRSRLAGTDWLDPTALARSAAALAESDAALEWSASRLADERIAAVANGFRLNPSGIPDELRRRLVLHILQQLGQGGLPRGEDVARLLDRLRAGGTATLAGVKCTGGESWSFAPAPPRRHGEKPSRLRSIEQG